MPVRLASSLKRSCHVASYHITDNNIFCCACPTTVGLQRSLGIRLLMLSAMLVGEHVRVRHDCLLWI